MGGERTRLRISDLERLSGVPRHTIHRYLREGLLPPPRRTGKTMAYYGQVHLRILHDIKEIKGSSRLPLTYLKKALAERGVIGMGTAERRGEGGGRREAAQERKRQIRDAAFETFLEKGYARTRVQDITAAAGVSTGTFYLYYADKREVFMEVVDELIRNAVGPAEEAFRRGGDFLKTATALAASYMENYHYFSGIINQLRGLMAEEVPQARDKFAALHNQLAGPIVRGIRAAIAEGLIREVDPELLARALMGILEFLSIYLSFDARRTVSEAVEFAADLLMNGLRADSAR